jgi:hypothetical protein
MPGYQIDQVAHRNFIYSDEATLDNIMDKSFIGFKFDPATGNFSIEEIEGNEVITLPEYGKNNGTDYSTWFWSKKNLTFGWDTSKPGHLIMEVF